MITEYVKNFGIEIETYNVNRNDLIVAMRTRGIRVESHGYTHATMSCRKLVGDPSIRGGNGVEVVSPILHGINGLVEIEKVCAALAEVGAGVNTSCGLHVHHEAQDLTSKQMNNLMKIYARCENVIDKMMPKSRRGSNNPYCKSATEFMSCESDIKLHHEFRGISRYYKVNLQSWYRQGTVEFRQHSGTIEADKIINWVILTSRILHIGKNTKSRTIAQAQNNSCFARLLKINKTPLWDFYRVRIKALA